MKIPTAAAMQKTVETATTPEAFDYLKERFFMRLKKANMLDSSSSMLKELDNIYELLVAGRQSSSAVWAGKEPKSGLQQSHATFAMDAIEQISGKNLNSVVLDFAISDQAELLRGYLANGEALDEGATKALDSLFNAWLVDNNMISEGGVIYKTSDKGEKSQATTALEFKERLRDPSTGFSSFVNAKKDAIELSIVEQPYPEKDAGPAPPS